MTRPHPNPTPAGTLTDQILSIRVDRGSAVPVYAQIATEIRRLLCSRDFSQDDELPSERTLCEAYGISRMTLRQALGILEREGFVEARRGRGTFVSIRSTPTRHQPGDPTGAESTAGAGEFTRLLSFRIGKPAASAVEFFGICEGKGVYQVRRLRLRRGAPVAVEFVQIPQPLCPTLSQLDLVHGSFYRILQERYGLTLAECVEEISASRATRYQVRLLEAPPSAAVLIVRRRTRTSAGVPALFEISIYRGDRYTAVRSVTAQFPDTAVPPGTVHPNDGNTETIPAARNELPGRTRVEDETALENF